MIHLFVWSLWNLRWSLRQLNTARIQMRISEREVYHSMALWFSILSEYMLILMYIRWGKRKYILTTSTYLIINRIEIVSYCSLELYWTASIGSFQTWLGWYYKVKMQDRIKMTLHHFSFTWSSYQLESFYYWIHTETRSGKFIINGHFTKMMNILRAYVDAGFNVWNP